MKIMTLVAVAEKALQGHRFNFADFTGHIIKQKIILAYKKIIMNREKHTEFHISYCLKYAR